MTGQCEKGWMTIEDRCSLFYREGVAKFIAFAYKNRIRNSQFCSCPCRHCHNRKSMIFALVRHDLLDYGMLDSYVFWSLHGEKSKPRSASASYVNQNNEADTVEEETVVEEVVEESRRDDRLNEFVDKKFGIFEGLNENVNAGDSEHPFQEPNVGEKYNKYQKLAEEKIYPTCENCATTLSVIVELHHVKKRFGWSANSVTYLLGLLRKWFPEGNTFPIKYPIMKEMLKDMGMKADNIHACINHCVLFLKDLKDEIECPSCGASRYKFRQGKDGVQRVTKESVLVLRHFPLPPRLKKYYTIPWISEDMTWHDCAEASSEYMRHPIDSTQWKKMKKKWLEFAKEA
ncbi:uncharacterized protein LOC113279457 [Papaver somniferum]|uniref:uncharacterized protein LOC113279457 n=1 Tax=Papaver somniferum TaxID=3469 RepID=UPI000E6F949E|nr:uncharacterized protein LOC113279457 [Papaver somniferum]